MTGDDYLGFLSEKRKVHGNVGPDVGSQDCHPDLFGFQRDIITWSLRKGRAAIFADTGLGKTWMQLEWARLADAPTLIVAPLAVAQQTIREASRLGIEAVYAHDGSELGHISVTNYERIGKFDPGAFGAVVLDESSILKSYDGKTRTTLIGMFQDVPLRLCCTATPAPNDIAEIANHAEFLGVLSRAEMLATFFVHDDKGWRLKGHAQEPFYRWLASWAMTLKRPSDLGYDDDGFVLPPLRVHEHWTETNWKPDGQLFATDIGGVGGRMQVRRATLDDRVEQAAALIAETTEPWIAWCGLNDEATLLAKILGDEAVNVEGSQSPEEKECRLEAFLTGEARVLVTKPKIAGFGLNMQHCARMVFVGLSDSFETYYQAIRRCWRFGQSKPVDVHTVLSEPERVILDNVVAKEREAEIMSEELTKHVAEFERTELGATGEEFNYATGEESGNGWRVLLGDSVERLSELKDDSIDLSVFSPPFLSLYTYTATERDLGNSTNDAEFWTHFHYIIRELKRVVRPGRNVCVHVAQVPTTLAHHGSIGLKDLRGLTIEAFQGDGFIYHGEVCIDKDPQAQAIRTHAKGLLFVQKSRDAAWLRPGLADYILVFRSPGENTVPVLPEDVTNEDWIEWARPVWYGIRESDTLNVREARSEKDERHIAPLQLGTIERCIRLWSNPGETVLSPFAGIGSEGYQAILLGREFVGIELKPEYWNVAVRNLRRAEQERDAERLFDA